MANQTQYIVVTPLRRGRDKKTNDKIVVNPGDAVTLTDDEAAPLLACRAIRLPDGAQAVQAAE